MNYRQRLIAVMDIAALPVLLMAVEITQF